MAQRLKEIKGIEAFAPSLSEVQHPARAPATGIEAWLNEVLICMPADEHVGRFLAGGAAAYSCNHPCGRSLLQL